MQLGRSIDLFKRKTLSNQNKSEPTAEKILNILSTPTAKTPPKKLPPAAERP